MASSQRFLLGLLCVCLGLVLADSLPRTVIAGWPWLALAFLWCSVVISLLVLIRLAPPPVRLAGIGLVLVLAAGAWGIASRVHDEPGPLPYHQLVSLTGTVTSFPQLTGRHQNFILTTTNAGRPLTVFVTDRREPAVRRGATLSLTGELAEPVNRPEFPEADWLAGQDIFAVMRYPKIRREQHPPPLFWQAVNRSRDRVQAVLTENLPEPMASLALGLSIGIPPTIDPVFADNLRRTNLTHLAAVSGQNLTLSVFFVFRYLRRFWLRGASILGLALLGFYSLMVGAQASVIRASLMSGLVILSLLVGRPSDGLRLLFVAATLIGLIRPLGLTHDIGFGLSVFALAGIILIGPMIEARLGWLPPVLRILVATTTAATLAVAPIQVASFGTVSLVGIPANLLVGLLVPAAMGGALVASSVGSLIPLLARPVSLMLYAPLRIIYLITNWLGSQPWAQIAWPLPPTAGRILIVAGLVFLVGLAWYRFRRPAQEFALAGRSE